jgi:hypothetical protein
LEAGLRAILAMVAAPGADESAGDRAAPIHGGGDDPGWLFADLVEHLLAELEDGATLVRDVRLDGVLRNDDGGYIAWGYAIGTGEPAPEPALPRLVGVPEVVAEDEGVIVRASVPRS